MPFLSSLEKEVYLQSLADDWSGDSEIEVFRWSEVTSIFTDAPHILLGCVPLFFSGVTVRPHGYTIDTIMILIDIVS